jgi:magnesium chelatase family protein
VVRRGGRSARSGPACGCAPELVERYQRRISGPLRDRIDLVVEVQPIVLRGVLRSSSPGSAEVASQVAAARRRQEARQGNGQLNAGLHPRQLESMCPLGPSADGMVTRIASEYGLSGRGFHGVLRVARTIADLDGLSEIQSHHLLEACGYRAS